MAQVRYKGRIALLAAAILIVFTGIGVRLALLHLRPAGWVLEPISEGRVIKWKPMGNRGRIVDCNGEILAMDLDAYHVCADPAYIGEHGSAFRRASFTTSCPTPPASMSASKNLFPATGFGVSSAATMA